MQFSIDHRCQFFFLGCVCVSVFNSEQSMQKLIIEIEFACALFLLLTIIGEQFIVIHFIFQHYYLFECFTRKKHIHILFVVNSGHLDNSFYCGRLLYLYLPQIVTNT